jgi:hypothetical protein
MSAEDQSVRAERGGKGRGRTEKREERLVGKVVVLDDELIVGRGEAVESANDARKDSTTGNCEGAQGQQDPSDSATVELTVAESSEGRVGEQLILVVAEEVEASQSTTRGRRGRGRTWPNREREPRYRCR